MTTFAFTLSSNEPHEVSIVIFDLLGVPVARPLRPAVLKPGRYTIMWRGTNWRGEPIPEGSYVVEYRAGRERALAVIAWPPKA